MRLDRLISTTVLQGIILEEIERLQEYIDALKKELDSHPKGSIVKRKGPTGKMYLYLNVHTKGSKKRVSTYIGPLGTTHADNILKQCLRRNEVRAKLRSALAYQRIAKRSSLHAH